MGRQGQISPRCECDVHRPVFKEEGGVLERGSCLSSEYHFAVKDVCPGSERCGAVIFPNLGKIKAKFIVGCMQGSAGEGLWKGPDPCACGF